MEERKHDDGCATRYGLTCNCSRPGFLRMQSALEEVVIMMTYYDPKLGDFRYHTNAERVGDDVSARLRNLGFPRR